MSQRKAVALISGGLDSMLAAKLMLDQGIHVEGLNFYTGFCVEGHTHAIRKNAQKKPKRNNALWVAEQLGIKLHIIDVVEPYKDIVLNPKHGYGANINPCLDCKIFMVGQAKQWMAENGFDFLITGEVIGQRPKSQLSQAMKTVCAETESASVLLRPLCAKLLAPTLPETEGWVDREKLLDLNGRSRKPQMAMAKEMGIDDYSQPAGGCCFLTNKEFSAKLQDLWSARSEKKYEIDDIMLLKIGRHIRPAPHYKLIISREEGETQFLQGYKRQFTHLEPISHPGPLALVEGKLTPEDRLLAAQIVARYSKGREADKVNVKVTHKTGEAILLPVTPLAADALEDTWKIGA